jgi:hypothetical protein
MRQEHGLWLAVGGGSLAERIHSAIESRGEFSYPVPDADYKPRRAELIVVSLYGRRPDYLGVSLRSNRGTTGQTNVMISNLIPVRRLEPNAIQQRLSKKFDRKFDPPKAGIYRPTPKLWSALLEILVADNSDATTRVNSLQRIISEANLANGGKRSGDLEIFERDAIGSALQAWGGPSVRRRVLRSASPVENKRAPFLERLKDVAAREDPQINHDHTAFPGMSILQRDVVSAVTLTDGSEQITILNCNRQPLEQTLGVDLIYYSHRFEAFVLVQYKRMVSRSGQPEYRPNSDPNHAKEMARMKSVEKLLSSSKLHSLPPSNSYRLNSGPFFIKLCEAKASIALDSGLVTGMYLPLKLWESLLLSPQVVGPKGGISITWENCTRRFTNSEFTSLLRYGWIGSNDSQTKQLSHIIEQVLASGRMLVLAATKPGNGSKDYRRDNRGQFAAEDDLEGAI